MVLYWRKLSTYGSTDSGKNKMNKGRSYEESNLGVSKPQPTNQIKPTKANELRMIIVFLNGCYISTVALHYSWILFVNLPTY